MTCNNYHCVKMGNYIGNIKKIYFFMLIKTYSKAYMKHIKSSKSYTNCLNMKLKMVITDKSRVKNKYG